MNANSDARPCLLALAVLSLLCSSAQAQIVNGSFEEDGEFSLEGWYFAHEKICGYGPMSDPPPGGGTWSLRVTMSNIKGKCTGVLFQVVPQVQSGEIWRLTAWARQHPLEEGTDARLFWTTFEPGDFPESEPFRPYGNVASTSSREWVMLEVVDTLYIAPGDSVGAVLDAGAVTPPTPAFDSAYFDLVLAERIGVVSAEPGPEGASLTLAAYPNPARGPVTVAFDLPTAAVVTLVVYDLLGREVARLVEGRREAGVHRVRFDGSALPSGVYLYRLQVADPAREAGDFVRTQRMLLVR